MNYENGGRPKPPNGPIRLCRLDDVGTRGEHLMELHDIWSFAYGYLIRDGWHPYTELAQTQELSSSLKLLTKHIESCASPLTSYAVVINALPRDAKNIGGSQGESNYGIEEKSGGKLSCE